MVNEKKNKMVPHEQVRPLLTSNRNISRKRSMTKKVGRPHQGRESQTGIFLGSRGENADDSFRRTLKQRAQQKGERHGDAATKRDHTREGRRNETGSRRKKTEGKRATQENLQPTAQAPTREKRGGISRSRSSTPKAGVGEEG